MPEKRIQVRAERLFRFSDIVGDRHLINTTVGPGLNPVLFSLHEAPDYRIEQPGWASFPKKWAARPNHFRIHHRVADEVWTTVDLPETDENYHQIQPLGHDKWLVVRGRAKDEEDRNAHVLDESACLVRSFHAGDGVEDVQTTRTGRIWVSYFDEGVFGSTGLGQSGLVCLDSEGSPVFEFASVVGVDVPAIDYCYALNVCSDGEVWLCYYSDFPLVRLVDGKPQSIWNEHSVSGSPGFAVSGQAVLFAGGYNRKGELFLFSLDTMKCRSLLAVDDGDEQIKSLHAFGRQGSLFLQTADSLFVLSAHVWESL